MGARSGIGLVAVTRGGSRLAARLAEALPGADVWVAPRWLGEAGPRARPIAVDLAPLVAELFASREGLVFFAAVAVAVRLIAPCLRGKHVDPAVVAVDDAGRYAVAVLSGHQGGANALAERVAAVLGATPVVTTASEARGLPALDLLGRHLGWRIERTEPLKRASAALVNGEPVGLFQEAGEEDWWPGMLPEQVTRHAALETLAAAGCPGLVITDRELPTSFAEAAARWVVYRPPTLVVGVGASSGVTAEEFETLAREACTEGGLAWASLGCVATLDRKLDEPGLVAFAAHYDLPLHGYPASALNAVPVPHPSATVRGHVGTASVCEAAALLASAGGTLVVPKRKSVRATVAIARCSSVKSDE
jgi:cobalt-precorrin 5A hydrolase